MMETRTPDHHGAAKTFAERFFITLLSELLTE
jgi:hypothetical protein